MASASDETALQFFVLPLTASATTPVHTARIHQLVVDNIRFNFARRPPGAERIIGTLLGSILPDGTGDIRDCFAVPHLESADSETPRVDFDFHRELLDAHLSGNPDDVLVGWYSTGLVVNVANAWIHTLYAREVESPIHLTLDTSFTNVAEGTVKAYLGSFGLLPNQALAVQFQQIPVDLSLLVPEKPLDIDDSFGPQLLHWRKFERADKAWIEKFGQLLSTNLEIGYGVEKRSVPSTILFEMDDQLFAADDRPVAIPSCVTRNLVSHERFFLSWASLQEESIVKGGILADDRNLDKIGQTVCFVLVQREVERALVAGAVGNTLVICSNIDAWTTAIAYSTLVGSTKVLVYEPETDVSGDEIMKYDFVIASYLTLKRDHSLLQSVQWNRVILDEAKIRTFATECFGLKSTYKWALTSDPFKNKYRELDYMVAFLKTPPYSFYFCQSCNCKTLHIEQEVCPNPLCGHDASLHFRWWKRYVARPIAKYGQLEKGENALKLMKYKYLRHLLLRRSQSVLIASE